MLNLSIAKSVEADALLHRRCFDYVVERRSVGVVRNGDEGNVKRQLLVEEIHDRNALRTVHSRRMAEDGVHHTEDGGVGSDAESERDNRGDGEAGHAEELAEG